MALVRFGGGVAELRGSIGGTTFSRARGGAYARNRTVPVNPNTLAQADVRTRFAIVVAGWSSKTVQLNVAAWNSFAQGVELVNRLGEAYTPSGRQAYLMINLAKLSGQLSMIEEPPASPNLPEPDAGITELNAATAIGVTDELDILETNALSSLASMTVYFDATPPLSPSITNVENLYKRIKTFNPTPTNEDLLANYNLVYPEINPAAESIVGKIIRWRYRVATTTNPLLSTYNYGSTPIVQSA